MLYVLRCFPQLAAQRGENGEMGGKKNSARWEDISLGQIRSYDNGIWLCPSCHTTIDKNHGVSFPVALLKSWKEDHEKYFNSNPNTSSKLT